MRKLNRRKPNMAKDDEWQKQEGSALWQPKEVNEELRGEVVKAIEGTATNFGPQWEIKDENDEVLRTPSHKVLQARMGDIKEGDFVRIVFTGTKPPKIRGQSPTMLYDVFKRKR
jgi:hypothetical protein